MTSIQIEATIRRVGETSVLVGLRRENRWNVVETAAVSYPGICATYWVSMKTWLDPPPGWFWLDPGEDGIFTRERAPSTAC
jgi:hypothetical protein